MTRADYKVGTQLFPIYGHHPDGVGTVQEKGYIIVSRDFRDFRNVVLIPKHVVEMIHHDKLGKVPSLSFYFVYRFSRVVPGYHVSLV